MTDGWLERLKEEYDELEKKRKKLAEYMLGPEYNALRPSESHLMPEQAHHMRGYAMCLEHRIRTAESED